MSFHQTKASASAHRSCIFRNCLFSHSSSAKSSLSIGVVSKSGEFFFFGMNNFCANCEHLVVLVVQFVIQKRQPRTFSTNRKVSVHATLLRRWHWLQCVWVIGLAKHLHHRCCIIMITNSTFGILYSRWTKVKTKTGPCTQSLLKPYGPNRNRGKYMSIISKSIPTDPHFLSLQKHEKTENW